MTVRTIAVLAGMGWGAIYSLLCWVAPYRRCGCGMTGRRLRLGRRAWNAVQTVKRAAGR